MFHLKPRRTCCWHVKAYFLGKAWMSDHETFSRVNLKYIQRRTTKQDTVFTCSSAIIYKFYLPGASTNNKPCIEKQTLNPYAAGD